MESEISGTQILNGMVSNGVKLCKWYLLLNYVLSPVSEDDDDDDFNVYCKGEQECKTSIIINATVHLLGAHYLPCTLINIYMLYAV